MAWHRWESEAHLWRPCRPFEPSAHRPGVKPDEIYNLAAQSFVASSWDQPILTAEVTGVGAANMLEAMRLERPQRALLPGLLLGDVRPDPGADAERDARRSTRARPMPSPKLYAPLDDGELSRELRPARLVAASCSTTRARCAASSSSPARSPTASRASSSGLRRSCGSAISTPSATGAMRATMSGRCG